MNPISAFAGSERAIRFAALLAAVLVVSAADAAAQLTAEDLARVAWIEETAISPDARWVAYIRSLPAAPGQGARRARDLFLIPAAGGKPRLLVSAEHAPVSPSWSPDGARLAFIAEIKSRAAH
jgi:Tol biopolymer transport system component